MPDKTTDALHACLEDVITLEKTIESHLRAFAEQGEGDEEVRGLFISHAEQALRHREMLAARLELLGEGGSKGKNTLSGVFSFAAKLSSSASSAEGRITEDLIAAFTIESSACAAMEGFLAVAEAAGDDESQKLVRQLQDENRAATERFWHLIPSRSKIAFNMATLGEINPAVETRAADNRIVG